MPHKQDRPSVALPQKESSYWLNSSGTTVFPALSEATSCDVAVIGGGIAGLTTAYKLKEAGLRVAVLEKNTIASGTTGGTTGKVTTQHGLIYAELTQQFGKAFAKQYADVSQKAFDDIQTLVRRKNIACGWHTADNYVYTTDQKRVAMLQREAAAASALGLPASFEKSVSLPFTTRGAVTFAGQAYFNAPKYVREIARLVDGGGSYVFEHSEATAIHEGRPCVVKTRGGKVTADYVVVATKVPAAPLIGRFTYAATEYPVTSYIIAGKYTGDLQGMYISPDKTHYSLLPVDTAQGRLLLVGGESHLPGIRRPMPNHQKLAAYAAKHFGITEVPYRWKAMDYLAYDSLPLVGRLYPWSKHAYMIGGFKKWGLNLSMVAATILQAAIAGQDSRGLELFSPHRLSAPASIPKAIVKYFQ